MESIKEENKSLLFDQWWLRDEVLNQIDKKADVGILNDILVSCKILLTSRKLKWNGFNYFVQI